MKAHLCWTIISCILIFQLQVLSTEAEEIQFQFEVFVQRYQNQRHRNATGNCCTGRGRSCNNLPCNNQFIFCAGPSGVASVANRMCPYGVFNFTNATDDLTLTEASLIVPGSQVPNPIVFRGSGRWTGRFQLNIVVNNIRTNGIQLVDTFNRERALSPSTEFTSQDRVRGSFDQDREFELSYQVRCATNYYGPNCNVRCVPTERFTCDRNNGNIVCRAGYESEATNCSTCVSASGCAATTLQESETVTSIPTNNSPSGDTGNGNLGTGSSSNQTTTTLNPLEAEQQGGLSQGGVAGVVIVVLLIVALIIGGVVIGVVFWVYQPWSNGWFGVEARLKNKTWREDAISNPVYEETEMDSSQNAVPPVRGVKYTPTTNGETAGNGQVNLNFMTQSLDDDNPLYASSALEKILSPRESNGTRNANGILQEKLTRGMANGHAQSNGGHGMTASPQHNIAKIATLRESSSLEHILLTADVRDLTNQNKTRPSGPPPVPLKPKIQLPSHRNSIGSLPRAHGTTQEAMTSFLTTSQSLDNLLKPNPNSNFLNPYGEYGDKTLQRVASGNSVNEVGPESNGKTAKNNHMFDNPDYEFVDHDNSKESDQPKDIDYEEI